MKLRFTPFALSALLVMSLGIAQTPPAAQQENDAASSSPGMDIPAAPTPTKASAWIVMDYATGQVLAGDNIHERVEPASITKVMTAYIVAQELRNGTIKEDDEVLMSERAWREGGARTDGSFSGFPVNQRAPLKEMEIGMAVQSGNDAAIALAEHVAGTQEAFAELMNQRASALGLKDTHFVNAHGLSAPEHYSTAYDLAMLGRAFIHDYPDTYAYNKIKQFTVNGITQPNRNVLLWRDSNVDGIKTGHHSQAGYCLMTSAERDGQRIITVIMGAGSERQRADDSQALLNWAFRYYETHHLYRPGQVIATQRVWKGKAKEIGLGVLQPLSVTVERGRYNELKPEMDIPKNLVAPIDKDQPIGVIRVSLNGKVIAESPLVANTTIEQAGFFKRLWDAFWMWWESD